MKYSYLLINFFTIVFPIALSFDKRVAFYKSWKFIWPGMAITGLFFLVWDVLFTVKGVWSFNPNYITGIAIFHLPIEEVLFFLTVPFACLFVYACLNRYVKWQLPTFATDFISTVIIVYGLLNCFFNYHKLYTLVTFALLTPLLIIIKFVYKLPWLTPFYRAFIVALVPFYIVNGILTSVPIVLYNNAQNLGIRIWTIPLEDHFYCMALLLMNVGFFEFFKDKSMA